jgi:predicted AAA+ superfamily ATPase
MKEEKTFNREINAFLKTNMQYEKIILTLDKENRNENGIKIINIVDFVLNKC